MCVSRRLKLQRFRCSKTRGFWNASQTLPESRNRHISHRCAFKRSFERDRNRSKPATPSGAARGCLKRGGVVYLPGLALRPRDAPLQFSKISIRYHRTSRIGEFSRNPKRRPRQRLSLRQSRSTASANSAGGSAQARMRTANGARSAMRTGQVSGAGSRRPDR
jgi:hypothetical protein